MKRVIAMMLPVLLVPAPCLGQGRIVVEGGEALVKQMTKRGGATAAREVAEIGGSAAARETLERAAREGGEQLATRVSRYGALHGPVALRAMRASPARMVAALDELPENLVRPALRAAAREPDTIARLVASHGAGALESAARHPGVGSKLITSFGDDGVKLSRKLTTDQAVVVARHADEIAKLPAPQRAGVMQALAKSPARVVGYLERHPKVLLTAAGVVTLVALKDEIVGTTQLALDAAGNPIAVAKPGFIERLVGEPVRNATNLLGIVAAAILAGWGAIQLRGAWRLRAIRVRVAQSRI
ncbi:MAG TPA: hypothetical protein VGR35_20835 [Tepidisphaeraceae bacterium]|nr:hypothetical protein [Tepidisphaeraceae bacterium]